MKRMHFIQLCALLIFLFACQVDDAEMKKSEKMYEKHNLMIDILDEQIRELERKAEVELSEPTKGKYRAILPALRAVNFHFNTIHARQNRMEELLKDHTLFEKSVMVFDSLVSVAIPEILTTYENLLLDYGEPVFGLKSEEVTSHISNLKVDFTKCQNEWIIIDWQNLDEVNRKYDLQNLEWEMKFAEYTLMKEMSNFYGGRSSNEDNWYFPVVNPKKCAVKVNEPFVAEIFIGTYSSQIDPKDLTLVVNEDTLHIDESGKALIAIKSSKVGINQLRLSCSIVNPFTSQISFGDSSFEYEVLSK